MTQQQWPYWAAVAVSPASFLATNGTRHPLLGCGACLELRCDPRPGFEVRAGGRRVWCVSIDSGLG